ncbi:MAG: HAMP domain-containing sensor histidine kinase, partial [Actinomyces sp.]|nr:HAMP domain-containing sensor histidine kinase [Actinomyces sp.]
FEARQASEQKIKRFVSDASHELRTPLAAISGYCELYAMGGVPAERTDEVMGRIASESSRMATLVEDLLTLARLDEGRPLDITDIDLVKLADNAVFDLQALDPTRTVGLTGISGRTPPMTLIVPGDRDRLSQVFTNLIGNIVRYTPEGSPVEIALGRSGDTAIVELRDHGPGIDETDRGRVFERFYRADSSRNRKSGGSGLGLAIVSGILAAHRGNASLTKTKGGGLTVRIELPTT